MPATRLVGHPAAPGLAHGPVVFLDAVNGESRAVGDPGPSAGSATSGR